MRNFTHRFIACRLRAETEEPATSQQQPLTPQTIEQPRIVNNCQISPISPQLPQANEALVERKQLPVSNVVVVSDPNVDHVAMENSVNRMLAMVAKMEKERFGY